MRSIASIIALVCLMAVAVNAGTATSDVYGITRGITSVQTIGVKLSTVTTGVTNYVVTISAFTLGTSSVTSVPYTGPLGAIGSSTISVASGAAGFSFQYTPPDMGSLNKASGVTFTLTPSTPANGPTDTLTVALLNPGTTKPLGPLVPSVQWYGDASAVPTNGAVQASIAVNSAQTHLFFTYDQTVGRVTLADGTMTTIVASAGANINGIALIESSANIGVFVISDTAVWVTYSTTGAAGTFGAIAQYDTGSIAASVTKFSTITVGPNNVLLIGGTDNNAYGCIWAVDGSAITTATKAVQVAYTVNSAITGSSVSALNGAILAGVTGLAYQGSSLLISGILVNTVANAGTQSVASGIGVFALGATLTAGTTSASAWNSAPLTFASGFDSTYLSSWIPDGSSIPASALSSIVYDSSFTSSMFFAVNSAPSTSLATLFAEFAPSAGFYSNSYGGTYTNMQGFALSAIASAGNGVVYAVGKSGNTGALRFARILVIQPRRFFLSTLIPDGSATVLSGYSLRYNQKSQVTFTSNWYPTGFPALTSYSPVATCSTGGQSVTGSAWVLGGSTTSSLIAPGFLAFTPAAADNSTNYGVNCILNVGSDNLRSFPIGNANNGVIVPPVVVAITSSVPLSAVSLYDSSFISLSVTNPLPKTGGASLSISCSGFTVSPVDSTYANPGSACLSQSALYFKLKATTVTSPAGDVTCSFSTAGDLSYLVQTPFPTLKITNGVVALKGAWTVTPSSSAAAPVSVNTGSTQNIVITPFEIPASSFTVTALCTNLIGTGYTATGTVTTGASVTASAATIALTFDSTMTGNVRCTFQLPASGNINVLYPAIPDAFFSVKAAPVTPVTPATPLVVTGVTTSGTVQVPSAGLPNTGTSASTFNIGINGPATALTSGTATVTLTCAQATIGYTSTITGVSTSGTGTNTLAITWSVGAAASVNVPLTLSVGILASGVGANVLCSWSAFSGPATSAIPALPIKFFVGAIQAFTATANPTTIWQSNGISAGDAAYTTTVTVTPPASTTIDTSVSLNYGCKSTSGSTVVAASSLTFTTTAAKTFTVTSLSSDATAISCTFTVDATSQDAAHYTAPAAVPITVNPTLAFGVSGVPPATGNTASSYTVVISRPTGSTIVSADVFNGDLQCTTSSSSASVAGVTVSGPSSSASAFTLDSTTTSKTLTIALTTLVATAGAKISCTWAAIGSTSSSLYKVSQPMNFNFWVGTNVALTATPSATSVITGQQITVQISGAASVIDSSTTLSYTCSVCGVANTGSVTASGSSLSFTGTFPSAASTNTFTLTGGNVGQVTCRFSLDTTSGDYIHFTAPGDLVITVLPLKTLTLNVDSGIGAVAQTGLSYLTPIAPAASGTTTVKATVNAPNPGYAFTLQISCTGGAVTPTGADSVSGTSATFIATTTAAAVFSIAVTNPTAPAGVVVSCSFSITSPATPTYVAPGAFDFYVGTVAALSAAVNDPSATSLVYPGTSGSATACTTSSNAGGCDFASVTVSAGTVAAPIPSLGFSATVTCLLGNSASGVYVTSSASIVSSTNSLTLTINPGASTTTTYFVRSASQSGSVTCTYTALSGADFRHYTLPSATTITITAPITVTASGAALLNPSVGAYQTVAGSTITTAATNTLTVTTSSVVPAGVTLTVAVACNTNSPAGAGSNANLVVTPNTFDFISTAAATTNFVITQPVLDTAYTHYGEYVSCSISYSTKVGASVQDAPIINFASATTAFSYFVGTAVNFAVTSSPTTPIYANTASTTDSYNYILTPSYCFGEGYVTYTASCAVNGVGVGTLTTTTVSGSLMAASFTPGTLDGTYVCTFKLATFAGVAPTVPAPISITVLPRRKILLTLTPSTAAVSSSAATAPTITGSVTLSAAPTNGLTVLVSCSSATGAYTIPGMSRFYFFATTPAAQTFTFSGQLNFYGMITCTAVAENIIIFGTTSDTQSDLDAFQFVSATASVLVGTQYQFTIAAPTVTPCNSGTISVTVPWVSSSTSTLKLTGSCNSGVLTDDATNTNSFLTFASGSPLTQKFRYVADARGANVQCTWTVSGTSTGTLPYAYTQYATPAATTFTVGTPSQSITVTPPPKTALLSGATSAAYSVAPTSAPTGNPLIVNINVSGGGSATPSTLTFTSTAAQTFTVTAPTAVAGTGSTLTVTYSLSDGTGSGAPSSPYYAVPASSSLTVSNAVVFTITAGTTYYTGSTATVNVKPDVAVGFATDITISCGAVFNTVVKFGAGDTAARPFQVPIPASAGSATCTATPGNDGASYATVTPSSFTFSYTVNPAGSGGSSGGAAGSSTGTTPFIPCVTVPCGAFATVSMPNLVLYAAMLLAAVFAARQ